MSSAISMANSPDQAPEVVQGAELRQDVLVAALRRTDCPGAADILGAGGERVVGSLAIDAADGMNRGQVEDIESHVCDIRQAGLDVAERAVASGVGRGRPREQLVPGAELGPLAIGDQFARLADAKAAVGIACGNGGPGRVQGERLHRGHVGKPGAIDGRAAHLRRPSRQRARVLGQRPLGRRVDDGGAHLQGDADVALVVAPLEFAAPGFEMIDPGGYGIAVTARRRRGEIRRPYVIPQGRHLDFVHLRVGDRLPREHGAQLVVSVSEAMCLHAHALAGARRGAIGAHADHRARRRRLRKERHERLALAPLRERKHGARRNVRDAVRIGLVVGKRTPD